MRIIVPGEGVVDAVNEMRAFESDGLTAYRQLPLVVVLPRDRGAGLAHPEILQRAQHPRRAARLGHVAVGRRAAAGGCGAAGDEPLQPHPRRSTIPNRAVVAQPGVTNLGITNAVEQEGFYYAPDPSSQIACSIGGNVAENSGGVHCLKYGLTANNVLGIEMVLMDGEVVRLGGKHLDAEGYDLLGVMTGSEGLLGVVTEVTVRILKKPETARALLIGFPTSEQGGQCVADIIGAGIIPGGMEMMDRPAIHAAEDFVHAGYPLDVEALLIVELDGPGVEVDHLIGLVEAIALQNGSTTCRISTVRSRSGCRFWAGRKAAFPAVGRISPDYYCMDGTIPRKELPKVLAGMRELSEQYGLRVANVFHAGDGNLHPLILYDANMPGELDKAESFGADILRLCVKVGGVLTGEHGVGVEKRDLMPEMFNADRPRPADAGQMRLRPEPSAQPGKGVPAAAPLRRTRPHACAPAGKWRFRTFRGFEGAR